MKPQTASPDAAELARSLEAYLSQHPDAAVLEDGRVLFQLPTARCSVSTAHGRCILHLWSETQNLIRTIVSIEERGEGLRVEVRRLGKNRTQTLQLVHDLSRRAPSSSKSQGRAAYVRLLGRALARAFAQYKVHDLRSTVDLKNSFSPAYARGLLVSAQQCWAIIGVSAEETQASIESVLTPGILWLAHSRQNAGGGTICRGLKVIVPEGSSGVTQARMAWLNRRVAGWELYELCEASEELRPIDVSHEGNVQMRLLQAFDPTLAIERVQPSLDRILRLLPEGMRSKVAIAAKSADEVALVFHGLEFARVRQCFLSNSFVREDRAFFGAGPNETLLDGAAEPQFVELAAQLFAHRHPAGDARNPLFRLRPEAWLESQIRRRVGEIEPNLCPQPLYAQVPTFASADHGVLDLLAVTAGGRLAVIEIKATEDLHLPLQGLDYWIRVRKLNERSGAGEGRRSALEQHGYFPALRDTGSRTMGSRAMGSPLLTDEPLLYFLVPALHVHPSLETVLEHLSNAIPWTLVALNEDWRNGLKVVFRKTARPG